MMIEDCRLQIWQCGFGISDCGVFSCLLPYVFCLLSSVVCPLPAAPWRLPTFLLNPQSQFLILLDYGGEDGNTFLKWVEAHTTAIE
jgi:hypothetical protein